MALALWVCLNQSALSQGFGQFGGGTRRGGYGRSSGNYPSSTSVGGATISVDSETRKLIVVTDEDTAKYISQVISNVDRPAPQVLIKVVFLEVTYRKGLDVGIEGSFTHESGDVTGNLAQMFGLARQGPNPSPPTTTITGAGIYSILGSDFTATLRAIAEAGKTEVLSRPSVLARNNQQAVITVGQEVPLIQNVRYDTFGNMLSGISYQNVGIILRVTPFITSDDMVEMIVAPEISSLSEQTVQISSGTNNVGYPVINSRSANTVVVTPNGQTIIIGGLMQTTKQMTESKIPVLGDIPWLGNLFKHKLRNDVKTELLIFLTPYIVKQPMQLAAITEQERISGVSSNSFTEQELNRFLDRAPTHDTMPSKKKGKKE